MLLSRIKSIFIDSLVFIPVWTRCRYTAKQRPNVFIFSESDARYNDLCVCYRVGTVCTTPPKIDNAVVVNKTQNSKFKFTESVV